MDQDPAAGPLRSFGRIRGRPIKPRQAALMETLLPALAVPPGPIELGANETWLEIGFGGGEHLAAQALAHPDVLLLGAEPFLNGVASALRHVDEAGLANVRLHAGDARDLVERLPEASLARVFILFPDPWPKTRHHKRRLIQAAFISELARVMLPGARLRFATDWADYADRTLRAFAADPRFAWLAQTADDWRRPPPRPPPPPATPPPATKPSAWATASRSGWSSSASPDPPTSVIPGGSGAQRSDDPGPRRRGEISRFANCGAAPSRLGPGSPLHFVSLRPG
jgi:tRNA (guanine-N7-)-methyltransferase